MRIKVSGWNLPASCASSISSSFFFQAEDGIRDGRVTGVQTCALPILRGLLVTERGPSRGAREGEHGGMFAGAVVVQPRRVRTGVLEHACAALGERFVDRKSTRLNSSHPSISYAVFCLKKKNIKRNVYT